MYDSILNRQRQTIVLDRCLDNSPNDLGLLTSADDVKHETVKTKCAEDAFFQSSDLPLFRSMETTLRTARKTTLPRSPKCASAIDMTHYISHLSSDDGTSYLLADSGQGKDRILMLGTKEMLTLLAESSSWHMDGTFWVCPPIFKQLFVIHA